ncbi:hypothetical protein LC087_06850 [Bacillus carboniphilus]|uniref:DUF4367 domain-containing protein n=1 Tax=Bacillus carboniphilus TaxID=86663 RepID=A0ABY9JWS3_9BACI|nr:hypothetical protein [Bacillus carboniphilus]WLR43834.1 hypothetical protein LC087_06850 [Bacillus carboniphilus]
MTQIKVIERQVDFITISDPPEGVLFPSDAVQYQYEVTFKDGNKVLPKKDDIIFETTIGKNSVVGIQSPIGKNVYTVFLYEYKENWIMNGYANLEIFNDSTFTNKEGLSLPMEGFNFVKLEINESDKAVWIYADEKNIVTISIFDREPFEESIIEEISIDNGNVDIGYIGVDELDNKYFYYFDSDKTVVISGNIKEKELISMAKSLPSVNSAFFPKSE